MAALPLGDQGAVQFISPFLFMQALDNRRKPINDDELEKRLKEYIDSRFDSLKERDFTTIKNELRTEIISILPAFLKQQGFNTEKEIREFIESLNYVLKSEFDARTNRLDRYLGVNTEAIRTHTEDLKEHTRRLDMYDQRFLANEQNIEINGEILDEHTLKLAEHMERLNALESQIKTLGSGAAVDQLIAVVEEIKAQIGNTNIKELNIPELMGKIGALERTVAQHNTDLDNLTQRIAEFAQDLQKPDGILAQLKEVRDINTGIDHRLDGLLLRISDLENKEHITPEKFEAYKAQITTEIQTLTNSVTLITTIQTDIDSIKEQLRELKSITKPEIGAKLEGRLSSLETQLSTSNIEELKGVKAQIDSITAQFNSELDKLRKELNKRIDEELGKLPTSDDFKLLKDLASGLRQQGKASFTALQDTLANIAGINERVNLMSRTTAINKDVLDQQIKQLTESTQNSIRIINEALGLKTKNKYLVGGNPDYGKYDDDIESHIRRANSQISSATDNITELLKKSILNPTEEHIRQLETKIRGLSSNPVEQNRIEKILLETIAVRNRIAHEVENGLYINDLLGIKDYAEENIAKIKYKTQKFEKDATTGKIKYPNVSAIKVPTLSNYQLDPKESITDPQIIGLRTAQIKDLKKKITDRGNDIRSFVLGLNPSLDKNKLFTELGASITEIYNKYTLMREKGESSASSEFILTETPTN